MRKTSAHRAALTSARHSRWPLTAALAVLLAAPGTAHAQEKKDCEPGSWFCAEGQAGASTSGEAGASAQGQAAKPGTPPPPVVVYQPPPPAVVVQARAAPPPYYYVPQKKVIVVRKKRSEWGVNLHLGGALMGGGRSSDASMALIGAGMRFRPIPHLGIQADLDIAGGRDYNGFRRSETAFAINGMLFLNPRHRLQVYMLGGIGWSGANVVDDRNAFDRIQYSYGYFGMQTGVGLELRLSKHFALNGDLRGMIRGRIDDHAESHPEFRDGSGRTTNTSGAGLLNLGMTFYW